MYKRQPMRRIVVNLAPATIRKSSAGLDLAIALGVLIASGQIKGRKAKISALLNRCLFMGEQMCIRDSFLGADEITIKNAASYVDTLKENFVMVDQDARRELISKQLHDMAASKNASLSLIHIS